MTDLYTTFFGQCDDMPAIEMRLRAWLEGASDVGLLALVAEQDGPAVTRLQDLCNRVGMPLLGAVFPELHFDGSFQRRGMLLIPMRPKADFHRILTFDGDPSDTADQIESLAAQISECVDGETPATLLLLFDALVPNIGSLLEALYLRLAESVHYAGANAGSETFKPIPCLFDNARFTHNGLLAILLNAHHGAVLEHSYRAPEQIVAATSTDGNRIISIGWQPAFEVYRDRIREIYGVEVNRDNFYDYAVHFPFGILRADDEVLVRIPVALEEDGSLFCVGEVPEHAVLTLLEAPPSEDLHSAQLLSRRLDAHAGPLLTFYCAGRRMHLGETGAAAELRELQQQLPERQVFGALSLGEIGSSQRGGYPLFHNATLVCMNIRV